MDVTHTDIKEVILMLEEMQETMIGVVRQMKQDHESIFRLLERIIEDISDSVQK